MQSGVTPKAPLIPIYCPEVPMEVLALDIAYLPVDTFCLSETYFQNISRLCPYKIKLHQRSFKDYGRSGRNGHPKYILTDQGSNVDGDINEVCAKFGIEKRRTSGYHSQGNGFAERNNRSISEIL